MTEPGLRRVGWLLRDVFVDALGVDVDVPGLVTGALLLATVVAATIAWRRASWAGWRTALVLVVPYLAWVALGQNLRDQPRHVLPLAALLAGALGLQALAGAFRPRVGAGALPWWSPRSDAHARRTIPPPGQQLVDLVRAQPAPSRIAVFGVSSIRFFERTELAGQAYPAASLGDVQIGLTRVDWLPARVWVTGEVETSGPSRWPLAHVATLCRPARIDRRAPCLEVSEWRPPFLPDR